MLAKQDNSFKLRGNGRGFTLIEVLIALAVFAIGILGVFSMQIRAINGNAVARGVTENYTSAMDKVEELMALPFDNAQLTAGEHSLAAGSFTQTTDGIDNDGDGEVDEGGETGYINIQWRVTDDVLWDQNIKSVRVTVNSAVNGGRQKAISIDFLKINI
ncbi:MAG: prepilin-type N-terminal cleavage/methylation domain-containing protein [Desulfobacterales bacterium]|nr:MAG: prepilin-type N-terminal cleavage/methylation domain-containing protein [Desulfobacterales bacterium]